jgi:hypothetical protein
MIPTAPLLRPSPSHLKGLDFLKEGVMMEKLAALANEKSDNECAALMQKAKVELFKNLSCHTLRFPTTYQYHFGLIS